MSHLHQELSKSFYLVGYLVSLKVRKKTKLGFFVSNLTTSFILLNDCLFCNFTNDDKDDDDDDVKLYKK